MAGEEPFEAGVFVLFHSGWAIVKRKSFSNSETANKWMDRAAGSQLRRRECLRVRGCIIEKKHGATLEEDLAEYEHNRTRGVPEFNAPDTAVKNPRASGKVRAGVSERQGQYLAFIHLYAQLHGQVPAEADLQKHFRVSPPSVHDMILMLERKGLISRTPGVARSIRVLVPKDRLPELKNIDR